MKRVAAILLILVVAFAVFVKVKSNGNSVNRYLKLTIAASDSSFLQPLIKSDSVTLVVKNDRPIKCAKYTIGVRERNNAGAKKSFTAISGENVLPSGSLPPDKDYAITVNCKGLNRFWTKSEVLNIHTPVFAMAAIGDSITFGAGTKDKVQLASPLDSYLGKEMTGEVVYASQKLSEDLGPVLIYNYGVSGISTNDKEFFDQVGKVAKIGGIKIAFINIGVNDMRSPNFTSATQYRANLEKAAKTLTDNGIKVIISKPYDVQAKNGIWASVNHELMRKYNLEINSIKMDNVTIDSHDHYQVFLDSNLLEDGVHPNDQGHRILGADMAESIINLLAQK